MKESLLLQPIVKKPHQHLPLAANERHWLLTFGACWRPAERLCWLSTAGRERCAASPPGWPTGKSSAPSRSAPALSSSNWNG